jgi:tetratricopeptide (TPR) repeat protein
MVRAAPKSERLPASAPSKARPAPTAGGESNAQGAFDADDLLKLANAQRRQRMWAEAAQTYQRVITLDPQSGRAYVARTAAASLRFEHLGDPRGALALYRAAQEQSPHGPLSEEVMWGIADCYRALGDRTAEVSALRAFVAEHPDSLMRANAERRLADLPP